MKQEVKDKWLEALRSGEYRQTKGVLHDRDADAYCCLGVLCDVARKEGLALEVEEYEDYGEDASDLRLISRFGEATLTLPEAVWEWAELQSSDPLVNPGSQPGNAANLSYLNDSGKTFEEIADLIEEHL